MRARFDVFLQNGLLCFLLKAKLSSFTSMLAFSSSNFCGSILNKTDEICRDQACIQSEQVVTRPRYSFNFPTQVTDHTATISQIRFSSKVIETLLGIKVWLWKLRRKKNTSYSGFLILTKAYRFSEIGR
jgi:hypothetical protein